MSGIYTIPTQNALQSTLDAELSAGGTSMTLADDWSSYFTGVSATNPAILVIDRQDANGTDTPSKREYVEVTNVSGATFTIGTRGKNGSTDQVHSVGARVECVTDVETWRSIKDTFEVNHDSTDGSHDFSSSNVDFQGISLGAGTTITAIKDEDDMASDSDTAVPTQQSVKAYVDANTGGDASISFLIDGGGSAITTGIKGDIEVPFGCTITQATILSDQSGSIVVDIWKDTYANFPPTDADSITSSAPITISSDTDSQDSTLTGWTTSITAGDILRFNVDSCTTITRATVSLKVTKS